MFILGGVACSNVALAAPAVESVIPGIGQCGTEFTLDLVGAGFSDQAEVMLYSTGVACVKVKAADENHLAVTLKAEADCRRGSHAFRIRTPQGLSELRIFRVTPFRVVTATEPNQTPAEATPVEKNVTISGVLETADLDCFAVSLRKGEVLAAEVEAVRLGENLLDTVLSVHGPDGKLIQETDDTALFGQDPFLSIVAPTDGTYVVQLREAAMEGDENSRYALHLGTFLRPKFVFPAGGRSGETLQVRYYGDARGVVEQTLNLPPQSTGNTFELHAALEGVVAPTALPFRVSSFANVVEPESTGGATAGTAEAAELPVAFNGILQKPGELDRFKFKMAAGETFQFEALAQRLGSRADTVISIFDGEENLLVRNDDDGSHDSRLVFQAPAAGEYQLQVMDKRGSGGEDYFYRVEATEPRPDLTAFLPRPNRVSQERQTISVPRGNRVMTFMAARRQGVDSAVRVEPQSLPTGVGNFTATIAADQFMVPVVLEAAADAPFGGSLTKLHVTGSSQGSTVAGDFQQVVDLVAGTADTLYQSAAVNALAVAVVEAAPFKIRMEEPKADLAQDGTLGLIIHVERSADYAGPVDITFPYLPPWVDGPVKLSIPADKTSGVYVVHAFPEAQPRAWPICAEGRPGLETSPDGERAEGPVMPAFRDRRRNRTRSDAIVSTQLVTLNIVGSPVAGNIGRVSAEQGAKMKLVGTIERGDSLPEDLVATLEGLPNRVAASPVKVSPRDGKVEFEVHFEPTAPLGTFESLVCRLSGVIEGQQVSYCIGRGGVLKIEPKGGVVTDASGRPLSPLEVLRSSQK